MGHRTNGLSDHRDVPARGSEYDRGMTKPAAHCRKLPPLTLFASAGAAERALPLPLALACVVSLTLSSVYTSTTAAVSCTQSQSQPALINFDVFSSTKS